MARLDNPHLDAMNPTLISYCYQFAAQAGTGFLNSPLGVGLIVKSYSQEPLAKEKLSPDDKVQDRKTYLSTQVHLELEAEGFTYLTSLNRLHASPSLQRSNSA